MNGKWKLHFPGEVLEMDDSVRKLAPGDFIELSQGWTHFELAGPKDGPLVVLVQGFSVPYYVWDYNFPALVEAGFRVLRYDHYGRGFSDRPRVTYDVNLYTTQLLEIMDKAGLQKAHLVGVSMGGAIAACFTDRFSERVDKLVLTAPAGVPLGQPFSQKLIRFPLVGELVFGLFGNAILLRRFQNGEEYAEEHRQAYLHQLTIRGYKRSLLSTFRGDMLTPKLDVYERLGKQDRRVLLIWGTEDDTVPYRHHDELLKRLPDVEFYPMQGEGHAANYEHPEIYNPLLIQGLKS